MCGSPLIGCNFWNMGYSNLKLYKFLAFKDWIPESEEDVIRVMKKYKMIDNDDVWK